MLWTESVTGVLVSCAGSEHAAVPKSAIRRSGVQSEDTRGRRDLATLRLPPDLRAAATGRLEGESQES